MKITLIFIFALVGSIFAIKIVYQIAKKLHIGSLPSPRKMHQKFTPLLGGIGFTVGIFTAIILAQSFHITSGNPWFQYLYFWLGFLVILIIGLLDDVKGARSTIKFSGQALAAALLLMGGCRIQAFSGPMGEVFSLGIFSIPFTFLWIIFIINAINLMDGLDGLAGGVALIITAGFIVISSNFENQFILILALGLAGGILGFLRYNYHPASIFMGDVGSLQLGYILAFFSIESLKLASTHQVYFLSSLILLGVPITDTLISFLRRLGQGQSPFLADKQHVHHRLIRLGLNHIQTVWLLYIFTAFYVVLGVFMVYFKGITGLLLFIIGFLFALFWVWRLGYVETRFSQQNLSYQFQQAIPVQKRAPLHFNRIWHRLLIFFSDVIAINAALYLTYQLKFHSGLFSPTAIRPITDYFNTPVFLLLSIGWLSLFFLNNLYHMDWDVSRFDKIWRVSKAITFGLILLAVLTADFQHLAISQSQFYSLLIYWVFLIGLVNGGRMLLIEIEKHLKIFEYSPKKSLIIGCNATGKTVLQDIRSNPHLIFDVIGFVSKTVKRENYQGLPVLGDYASLPSLIHQHKIEEVIIALPEGATEDFMRILSLCEPQQVKIKIPPGAHEIFAGKQVSLISHGYLQVFPESMVMWQWMIKRFFDIVAALIFLAILSPFFIFSGIYLLWKFRRSVFIRIQIVGKNGIPFNIYAFRITEDNYHYQKNPVYVGTGSSSRSFGGILKLYQKYRLYKLPQLFNVLLGDMSFVGPRPEPPEWYEKFKESLRFVHRRITVRPGLTGLAQVKYHYELSQQILQERVKFDIFYIENSSLRLDLRILLRTLLLIFKKGNVTPASRMRESRTVGKTK